MLLGDFLRKQDINRINVTISEGVVPSGRGGVMQINEG